jgi:hypothetical protein
MEYEINGKVTNTNSWFLKTTGTSRHLHNKKCARLNSIQVWEGKSELTKFTDVFSEAQEGLIVQRTAKRNGHITKIFLDADEQFYVVSVDIDSNEAAYSYMMDVTLETHDQKYTFDAWCKKFTGFSPDNYLSAIENLDE